MIVTQIAILAIILPMIVTRIAILAIMFLIILPTIAIHQIKNMIIVNEKEEKREEKCKDMFLI